MISRKRIDQGIERRMLTGMIVADRFLREVEVLYRPELVSNKHTNIVAQWCLRFFKQYEKAPGVYIKDIFDTEEVRLDDDTSDYIKALLEGLSEEFERSDKFNVDFLLDEVERHFKKRSLDTLSADLRECTAANDVEAAEALLTRHTVPARQANKGICPFTDEEAIKRAFEQTDEYLFRMPGALGIMVNPQLVRDGFILLAGPEKRGKSTHLREFAIRGFRQRCNVALFDTGDMTENQIITLLGSNLAGKPLAKFYDKGSIRIPVVDCERNQDNSCGEDVRTSEVGLYDPHGRRLRPFEAYEAGYKPCSACEQALGTVWYENHDIMPLTWQEALKNGRELVGRAKGRRFKISVHEHLTSKLIRQTLENWRHFEDFVPDLIVIDQMSTLECDDPRLQPRDKVDYNYREVRRIAKHYHALVITADQTDAASYDQEWIGKGNFTEDKRKHGHITAEYGLNQTDEEQQRGIMRFAEIMVREGGINRPKRVNILECRAIGRAYVGSYF